MTIGFGLEDISSVYASEIKVLNIVLLGSIILNKVTIKKQGVPLYDYLHAANQQKRRHWKAWGYFLGWQHAYPSMMQVFI